MKTNKSFEDIIEKVQSGTAKVLTAAEFKELGKTLSAKELVKKVDIVTTATFGPMCSSGAFLNFGHSDPPMRLEKLSLNGVPAYGGIAAVDAYIGATETAAPADKYGGAHVIGDLIAGKSVRLVASSKGTDCYPRKSIDTKVKLADLNEAYLFNPRNVYQNYAAATNSTNSKLYTYMGVLMPGQTNVNYSTSGEWSPLLNDPQLRTIGVGTRIFIGGAHGFVAWNGTQYNTTREKNAFGVPVLPAASLAVTGNLKEMDPKFIKAAYYQNYGTSLFVGIGIPIPVLDEEMAQHLLIKNKDIETSIFDYGKSDRPVIKKTNYEELRSGKVDLNGKICRTAPLSSINMASKIMDELKSRILAGEFIPTAPVSSLPQHSTVKSLKIAN
jgi:L-aspartate semialdehyde sulfurtransferase